MAGFKPAASGAGEQRGPGRGFGCETGCGKCLLKLLACLRRAGAGLLQGRLCSIGPFQDSPSSG